MRLTLTLLTLLCIKQILLGQLPDCQINQQTKTITFNGYKINEHTEYELQINSAKGTNHAEIEIGYKKGNNIKGLEAGIYNLQGKKIRTLKKKDIMRTNAFSYAQFHSDNMVLSFKLIHNQYPYIIKYSYSEEANEFMYLAYWVPRRHKNIIVKKANLNIEVPKGLPFRTIQTNIDSATVKELPASTIYSWSVQNVDYPTQEKYGPPQDELNPKVIVIPEHYKYGLKGSTKSWQSYGKWNHQLNNGLDHLNEAEKAKVKKLTQALGSDKEKVDTLYKYMQNHTRYINVSLDIGGLKSLPAESVCTNKYGDCKALSTYMHAILKEIGIKSIYTTVYAGENPVKIKPEWPSQQFNHVILCVPLENDTVWLECTDSTSPFNYLGTFTQNRTVLLVDGDNSKLTRTPALSNNDVENKINSVVQIQPDGEATLLSSIKMRGHNFDLLKGLDDGLAERDKLDFLDDLELFENIDILSYEIKRPHRDSSWLTLNIEASLQRIADPIGKRLLLSPINPFSINLEKPQDRTQALIFNYPINICDSTLYQFPQAIHSISGIKTEHIDSAYGSYQRSISSQNKNLTIHRKIQIKADTYDIEEYQELYDFITKCTNAELQKAIINYNSN